VAEVEIAGGRGRDGKPLKHADLHGLWHDYGDLMAKK
jgi:hypothetical protein